MNTASNDDTKLVCEAIQNGHAEVIIALRFAGVNVNTPDKDGRMPIHIAAECEHAAVVTALKAAGANVNKPDNYGRTPVYIAAELGYAATITALKDAGANMNTHVRGDSSLYVAVVNGHIRAVKALLEAGADAKFKSHIMLKQAKEPSKKPVYKEIAKLLEEHLRVYPSGIKLACAVNPGVALSVEPSNPFEQKTPSMLTQFNPTPLSVSKPVGQVNQRLKSSVQNFST